MKLCHALERFTTSREAPDLVKGCRNRKQVRLTRQRGSCLADVLLTQVLTRPQSLQGFPQSYARSGAGAESADVSRQQFQPVRVALMPPRVMGEVAGFTPNTQAVSAVVSPKPDAIPLSEAMSGVMLLTSKRWRAAWADSGVRWGFGIPFSSPSRTPCEPSSLRMCGSCGDAPQGYDPWLRRPMWSQSQGHGTGR